MENSSDTIGNRTRDLPTCSEVPQPTALRRAPNKLTARNKMHFTNVRSLDFSVLQRNNMELQLITYYGYTKAVR